jgi:hypothetical protein
MSALSLRLPNSLHEHARALAQREGISMNQLIATALAEKMAALLTEEYFDQRAKRGSRAKFLTALSKVPDVEPEPYDRLPEAGRTSHSTGPRPRSGSAKRVAARSGRGG